MASGRLRRQKLLEILRGEPSSEVVVTPLVDGTYAAGVAGKGWVSQATVQVKAIIGDLDKAGLRDSARIVVGGAPLTAFRAQPIGANAYAPDSAYAVHQVRASFDPPGEHRFTQELT